MKKFLLALCLSMAVVMVITPAYALELWDYHLRGVDEGGAFGALPPAGFYFINDSYFGLPFDLHDQNGHANSGVKVDAYIDVPILLWVPGCKFLGADYAAVIAQPFDWTVIRAGAAGAPFPNMSGGAQLGAYNTVLAPIVLSWKLPCDFRVKGEFQIGFNDGTSSPGDSVASVTKIVSSSSQLISKKDGELYAWASNDSYQFTPLIAFSYLHAGWNFSAEFAYTFYTKDSDTDYQNGDQFWAEYTISYTCGKWTFGLGAEQENQIQSDQFNAGTGYMSQPNTRATNYTMGPLLGYNFGPCSIMLTYNWELYTANEVGGNFFNARIVIPLGNPYPIK